MSLAWMTLGLAAVAFLIGGIPFGVVVGRWKGIDVRKSGSGNIGAANVGRLLGRGWGVTVFVLDTFKGFVVTLVAGWILMAQIPAAADATRALAWMCVGFGAILGHNYSPYLGFHGGKGVATSFGVAVAIYPELTLPALLSLAVWAGAVALTRMSSVGSLSAAAAFPLLYLITSRAYATGLGARWPYLAFAVAMVGLIVLRHHANIARILAGTENRLGRAKSRFSPYQYQSTRETQDR